MSLIADVKYRAPYLSSALNRSRHGIDRHGIYEGLDVWTDGEAVFVGPGVAVVRDDNPIGPNIPYGYALTIHNTGDEDATPPLQAGTYHIVIEAVYYNAGNPEEPFPPTGGSTTVDVKYVLQSDLRDEHVVCATLILPADVATTGILAEHIYTHTRDLARLPTGWARMEITGGHEPRKGFAFQIKDDGKLRPAARTYSKDYGATPVMESGNRTDYPFLLGRVFPEDDEVLDVEDLVGLAPARGAERRHHVIMTHSTGGASRARLITSSALQVQEHAVEGNYTGSGSALDPPAMAAVFSANPAGYARVVAVDREQATDYPQIVLFDFDLDAERFARGAAPARLESQAAAEVNVCRVATDKVFCVWVRTGSPDKLVACIVDLAPNGAILKGPITELETSLSGMGAASCALSETRVVVGYESGSSAKLRAIDIQGRDIITIHSEVDIGEGNTLNRIALDARPEAASREGMALFHEDDGTAYVLAFVADQAGDITASASTSVASVLYTHKTGVKFLDDDHFAICYTTTATSRGLVSFGAITTGSPPSFSLSAATGATIGRAAGLV